MTRSSVSCIVPVYNGERYLGETIDSILGQTLAPLEVIIVDDGSTDATAAVVKSYGESVRYIYQEHAGVSEARNHGVRLAAGDLLAFLDADDLFVPRKLERQAERFAVRPELDMSSAYTLNFWSPELNDEERDHDPKLATPWPRHISTWMLRPALFERVGGFDENMPLSQDVDWNVRAQASGAIIETLPDILSRRRLHLRNVTRRAQSDCRDAVLRSVRTHLGRLKGRDARKR